MLKSQDTEEKSLNKNGNRFEAIKKKNHSLSAYKKMCQKGDQENYILDKIVFRKISIFFTIPFIWIGAKPNQITFLSFFLLLSSFYFFTHNSSLMLLTGSFLVFMYYILDHVDGELARYYAHTEPEKKRTLDGQYLDVLCHSFSGNIIIFLFGITAWEAFGYNWAIFLSFFVSIGKNSFPEMVANKIIVQAIANKPEQLNESIKKALEVFDVKKSQMAAVRSPVLNTAKFVKLVKETLGFPGYLLLIMASAILDSFFSSFVILNYSLNFRLLLILFLFPFELIRLLVRFYRLFTLFKNVSIQP